jgi:hypothetical protein
VPEVRLNVWTPLEQPWDSPMSDEDQEMFAQSALIAGVAPTDAAVTALLSDNPALFVAGQNTFNP